MSLFKHLAALIAKGVNVQIDVTAADDGKLEVALIPTSASGKSGLNLVAKSFVGTPDELDADFSNVVAGYASVNATLADQLAAIQAQADAIAAQAQAAAKATANAPAKTVSSVTKSSATQKLNIRAAASSDVMGEEDDVGSDTGCDSTNIPPETPSAVDSSAAQVTFTL